MTALAILAQRPFVHILVVMTFDAGFRRILERLVDMTLLACRDGMNSNQRELCQIVIEANLAFPHFLVMAALALATLLPLMHIIFMMTVVATGT